MKNPKKTSKPVKSAHHSYSDAPKDGRTRGICYPAPIVAGVPAPRNEDNEPPCRPRDTQRPETDEDEQFSMPLRRRQPTGEPAGPPPYIFQPDHPTKSNTPLAAAVAADLNALSSLRPLPYSPPPARRWDFTPGKDDGRLVPMVELKSWTDHLYNIVGNSARGQECLQLISRLGRELGRREGIESKDVVVRTRNRELENRERQLRRKVRKCDLVLKKCFARDPHHPAFCSYGLADANNHAVLTDGVTGFGVSLDQISDFVDSIGPFFAEHQR